MSVERDDNRCEPARRVSARDASRLLLFGLATPHRPVDDLVDWLAECEDDTWFDEAVSSITGLTPARGDAPIARSIPLDTLRAAKDRAKVSMASAGSREDVAAATAAYFVTISAALVLHGASISRRPGGELAEPIAELAAVAPDAWAPMLEEAARRLECG